MARAILKRLRILGRYKGNPELSRKIALFRRALELRSVKKACQEVGKVPRYYYYWWNRFRDSGFQLHSLKKMSTRPKAHPRLLPERTARLIQEYRRQKSSGLDLIPLLLEKEHRIRVSRSSVYRVLKKAGLLPSRRREKAIPLKGAAPPLPPLLPTSLGPVAFGGAPPPPRGGRGRVREEGESPTLPQTLGKRFLPEKILGMGGGGVVYLARDSRVEKKKVALKVLELRGGGDPALVTSMRNEFTTLSSLNHPNLAKVFDFGQTDREVYFSGEWIEGPNILEVCRKANLNTVFRLIVQVLKALDYLHARGVLHLDLKPENILVSSPAQGGELQVKLIDFGTAEWRKKGTVFQGEFVGTPPYASPEIILEHTPSPASDIYSLGMIFYQIFAGRFPFLTQDPFEMMKEQVYGEIQAVEEMHPSLPDTFRALLEKMAVKNPAERLATPAQVLGALNECLEENFSLRGKTAPVDILAGCDSIFHAEIYQDLVQSLCERKPQLLCLSAAGKMGKSFLIKKAKEALQLRGIHPWLIEDEAALEKYLADPRGEEPLFIDLNQAYSKDWVTLLDRLENTRLPVLLSVPFAPSDDLNPNRWIEIPPLSVGEIQRFLLSEIFDFPAENWAIAMTSLSRGYPLEVEKVLHAMHEAGWMQWTDRGWRWVYPDEPNFSELLPAFEERWNKRLARVQEILHFSKIPIGGETLEGILGLDPGSLKGRLEEWEKSGLIQGKKVKQEKWYAAPSAGEFVEPPAPLGAEAWMEKKLEDLYREGAFVPGARMALTFLSAPQNQNPPPSLLIKAARHFVAAGLPGRALEILPPPQPKEPNLAGLNWEVRARALSNLGKIQEALSALSKAEEYYSAAGAEAGLSRLFNLRGPILERQQNFSGAEEAYHRAVELGRNAGEDYVVGLALMNLGALCYDRGKFDQAQSHYQEAFVLEKKAQQPLLSRLLRENQLNLLYHTGKTTQAREAAFDLLHTSLRQQDRGEQAVALNYLALLAGQENQTERKLQFLNQALEILDPKVHLQATYQTLSNRALVFLSQKKFAAAQLDAEEGLALGQRLSQPVWTALAHLALGRVYRDRPRPDFSEATFHLSSAHQLIYQNRIAQILWEVEFDRGLLAKRKGEKMRAKNYFLSAQKFLTSFLKSLPESLQRDFMRGRQRERIELELKELDGEAQDP